MHQIGTLYEACDCLLTSKEALKAFMPICFLYAIDNASVPRHLKAGFDRVQRKAEYSSYEACRPSTDRCAVLIYPFFQLVRQLHGQY